MEEKKTGRLKTVKYINDPVYGSIPVTAIELELIGLPIFQRLRGLRQLARVNFVFPGAEHSRFVHSLGVLYIMGLMTNHLLEAEYIEEDDAVNLRIAALLHDIGHYPLSHLGEGAYGYIESSTSSNGIVENFESLRKDDLCDITHAHYNYAADHEKLGQYIVLNNKEIRDVLERNDIDPQLISDIFTGEIGSRCMFYSQLLHSDLDADRLDYLLRDSYQTGVKYGLVDLEYLIRLLMVVKDPTLENEKTDNRVLVCNRKGQHVVEHFLMSRYFHYSQIIHHKTNGAFEGLVKCLFVKLLQNKEFMFNSLSDIKNNVNDEKFLEFTDSFLEVAMKKYYEKTTDEEYRELYRMYINRKRPKTVFEFKDLYDKESSSEIGHIKKVLDKQKDEVSKVLGNKGWGYQCVPITLEKIGKNYGSNEKARPEELVEAIKLYDIDKGEISYLADDSKSVIGRLSQYTSEFVRVFAYDEKDSMDYENVSNRLKDMFS